MTSAQTQISPLVELRGGSKKYGAAWAIRAVDFDVQPGEIHALLGENGAGKSTLVKALTGAISLDEGQVIVSGEPRRFDSPRDGLAAGIAMVYQDPSLVPTLTVAQNLELGHERPMTRLRALNISAQQLLMSMNFFVDPASIVETLGAAKKQMVEIARAIKVQADVIIFDEPTASLTPEETMHLFEVMRSLRAAGKGVIFISHALEEAFQVGDRITVLRDGEVRANLAVSETSREEVIQLMVGREVAASEKAIARGTQARQRREKVLVVENVTLGTIVKNISFTAYAGEVVGIAGLIGSGRTEIARIVAGSLKRNRIDGGRVYLNGKEVRYRTPRQAVADGIVYVTEDRKRDGYFETMTISDNLYLSRLAVRRFGRLLISRRERNQLAERYISDFAIRALSTQSRLNELSGGNQQKVVVAKALAQEPSVVIFDEPTRGVDVASIADIHAVIRRTAAEGKAVIVISSYLPEILTVSDRVLVARQGRIVAEFPAAEATEERIMYAAVF